jgi:light-regulated signal transduction histidine kinase (bacteriophytochrome)
VIKAYRWLPERQLGLFIKIDQAEAFRPMRKFRNTLVLISGIIFLTASAVAIGLARTITRPVLILQNAMVRFGRGEHGVRLPEARGDELGVLAKEFNTMAAALSEKEAKIREHAAQLEAANKELEAFSYSVSHDLRAPLRAIDGFSTALLEDYIDRLDDDGKRYLNIIGSNAKKMGQLIDDLLLFSRLGRQEIRPSDINMEKLAKTVFEELKLAVPERKVQMNINTLFPAQGGQAMIRQVFVNLLSNSIKFTRTKETAVIDVDGRSEGDENIYTIKDNGVGFDMRYVDKLFGVFQRLHSSEEFEGTGVGLAIVQRLIHRHGGRVWAEGKVNEGAIFSFTLPRREGSETRDEG